MARLGTSTLVAVAGAALLSAAPAWSAKSVAIDVSRITITEKLMPGGEYRLPTFGIRNPGAEPTTYRLIVTYADGESAHRPPGSWFRFTPRTVTLGAGESSAITTLVELPPSADSGEYAALVGAQIVSDEGGARVGATAAAPLTFDVEPSSWLQAWWNRVKRWLSENAPWTWVLPALVLSFLSVWHVRRRYAFSVARKSRGVRA